MNKQPIGWSDEEVLEWVKQLRANGMPDELIYAKVTKRVVDEFREQLATLEAENRALEHKWEHHHKQTLDIVRGLQAELEAAQADTYQPLPDGTYPGTDPQQITYAIEGNAIRTYLHDRYVGGMRLPGDWTVCRWQEGTNNE